MTSVMPGVVKRWLYRILAWLLCQVGLLLRATLRFELVEDHRPALRDRSQSYVMALLHAHQLAAVLFADEPVRTMASRSLDGDLIVPLLTARNIEAVRGSTRKKTEVSAPSNAAKKSKGGTEALVALNDPKDTRSILLTVDGPRGPRGVCHAGIVRLALNLNRPIVPMFAVAERRWELARAWDRFQIPKPFSKVRIRFGPPIWPVDLESGRQQVAEVLAQMEEEG